MKRFFQWFGLKEKLHEGTHRPPLVSQGDIWWASIGENVGSEINGKSDRFSRPVIVFKKLTHGFYFVIPTTAQPKTGTWFVQFKQKGKTMYASLHQARTIDYRRLYSKLGSLDEADQACVRNAFWRLYK